MLSVGRKRLQFDGKTSDELKVRREFISDMSYGIRDPLNAILGISELAIKNIEGNDDPDALKAYIEIIRDSAVELQDVIDRSFEEYESKPIYTGDSQSEEDAYDILHNLRILIVEDNGVSQLIAKELLENKGAIVTITASGEEGVRLFTSSITGTYDVIFMDIKMPGMDGYEATAQIRRSSHPQADSIPIIAMTADVLMEDIQNALRCGMNGHVAKPISIDKIVSAIKTTSFVR